MRLHSLDVRAFGPFPDAVSIDFDDVCSGGLFLIHGATGSGKTSLLDAICFALFADVPGARTKRGLASHHAAQGVRPLVTLDFTSAGRRFRVERSPEFLRPKKRGSGLLKVNAAVVLEERRGGQWVPVSTRHDEVAHVIDDVLGMGLAQFAKVVVLPQGDVSAFLRSSPEDRRAMLERLFDISTYTDIEAWLAEERRRSTAAVENALEGITGELSRLGDLGSEAAEPLWASMPIAEVPAALAAAAESLSRQVSELLTAADAAEVECGAAAADLHDARTLAGLRERGTRAHFIQQQAAERAAEIDSIRLRVRRAAAAEAVAGHLAAVDGAVLDESRTREVLAAQRAALSDPVSPQSTTEELTGWLERLDAAAPQLGDLAHAQTEAGKAANAVSSYRAALEVADLDARSAVARVAAARDARTATRRELERVRLLAEARTATEVAHGQAVRRLRLAEQVTGLSQGRESAAAALVDANEALLRAQADLLALRERQLEEMAGALAARLVEGEECPVCGSLDHPVPAHGGAVVRLDELRAAEEEHAAALTLVGELTRADAAVAGRVATLVEQLAQTDDSIAGAGQIDGHDRDGLREAGVDGLDLELLQARVADAAAALREATQAQQARDSAQSADNEAAALVLEAERTEQMTGRALAVAGAALDSATCRERDRQQAVTRLLDQHRVECGCTGGEELDVEDAGDEHAEDEHADDEDAQVAGLVRVHQSLRRRIERVLAAERSHADAVVRRVERQETADQAAADRGFTSTSEARAARIGQRELDALQSRVTDHDREVAVAEATLAEDAVAHALTLPEPDVATAAERDRAARRTVREAQAAHSFAESRLTLLTAVEAQVTDRVDRLAALRARARAVKDLADAVGGTGGGNELRMRLSSFVLAARLEQVVALANERLQTMDAGRYRLEHSDAKVAGGARSGLDLQVLDQWTGRTRETASLSGGEAFMVSLALALALADAVRQESGGFDLGTLFVDEGFGSLDEDSLEQVMCVLDELREGGRAVGVVSHVADLRARITHQVVVAKSTTGSQVHVELTA